MVLGVALLMIGLVLLAPAGARAVHGEPELVVPGVPDSFPPCESAGPASSDGTVLTFTTCAQRVPEDTDDQRDVYQVRNGVTELISTGPSDAGTFGAQFAAMSEDGSRVIFVTSESMTPDDAELFPAADVYERHEGVTTRLSTGPEGGNGGFDASFAGATPDATHVYFRSREHLIAGDQDDCGGEPEPVGCLDVYERTGGTTQLVSTGPNEPSTQDQDASYLDASADGTRVFFRTQEALLAEDADGPPGFIGPFDIYERSGASTTLVSTSALSPNQQFEAEFGDVSEDGSRVFFRTQEQLTADDTDGGFDVFERAAGATTRISTGTLNSNTGAHAKFMGVTPDGAHAFFDTPEQLEAGDADATGGDLYRRSGAQTTLISTGPLPVSAPSDFLASSSDGQRVVFGSIGQFVADDTDTRFDIYERFGGVTTHLSPGNANASGFDGATFIAASRPDATRVLFGTRDQVVPEDTDSASDLYEHWNGRFYLFSPMPAATAAAAASRDAGWVYIRTVVNDVFLTRIDGAYPRPKGATPVQVRLVPAHEECTAPNREHGPPLAFGSCNPPQQASDQLTVGTADANGQPAKSEGSLRLRAVPGSPATPADEADVQITFSITDVRRRSDLADYTGDVQPHLPLRITDRDNTPAPTGLDQGTSVATDFVFDAPCTATADATIGATCAATTSFDAIAPGAVKESKRSVWELGQVRIADDDPGGRATFMVQGLFVP